MSLSHTRQTARIVHRRAGYTPRAWHLCEAHSRQRRTGRRLGAGHPRHRKAAPPDGRRRPAASRTCQNARPKLLTPSLPATDTFLQDDNSSALSTFSHQRMSCNSTFSLRAASACFNGLPAFFSATRYASCGLFFNTQSLILLLSMLLAQLHSCTSPANAHPYCLLTTPDRTAQRALRAPSSTT